MLGDQALRLVQECRATDASGTFRPYNDELVRLVLLETRQLQSHVQRLLQRHGGAEAAESDRRLAAQLVTHHLAAQRNKRCLLAYHQHRLEWLKARLWETAGNVALVLDEQGSAGGGGGAGSRNAQPPPPPPPPLPNGAAARGSRPSEYGADVAKANGAAAGLRSLLSPSELGWLRAYAELLTDYKDEFLDVLDVAGPLGRRGVALVGGRGGVAGASSAAAAASAAASSGGGGGGGGGGGSGVASSTATLEAMLDVGAPTELMVTVMATRDARDVQTDRGSLSLRRGERMRLARAEVEALIVRGWLAVVDD